MDISKTAWINPCNGSFGTAEKKKISMNFTTVNTKFYNTLYYNILYYKTEICKFKAHDNIP